MARWTQFILSTPVVLWAGRPFFVHSARSLRTLHFNMFTLIAPAGRRDLRRRYRPNHRAVDETVHSGFFLRHLGKRAERGDDATKRESLHGWCRRSLGATLFRQRGNSFFGFPLFIFGSCEAASTEKRACKFPAWKSSAWLSWFSIWNVAEKREDLDAVAFAYGPSVVLPSLNGLV
jgi:hypothetical protein